jgi:hypothetical protein
MKTRRVITQLVTQMGTAIGSLVALAVWNGHVLIRIGLASIVVIAAGTSLVLEVASIVSEGAKTYSSSSRINRFMYDWISHPGQVVIFSNDMTWVDDAVHIRRLDRLLPGKHRRNKLLMGAFALVRAQRVLILSLTAWFESCPLTSTRGP